MNILQGPNKFFGYAACFGFAEAAFKTLFKLGLIADLRSLNIFCLDLRAGAGEKPPNAPPGLRVRVTSAEELARLRLAEGCPPPDVFQKKFSQGSVLFATCAGDTVLGAGWYNDRFADLSYIGKPFVPLLEGQVYLHGAWVSPASFGAGVGSYGKTVMLDALREKGYVAAFSATYLDHRLMRWQQHNGFRLWGRLARFRLGGRFFFQARRTALGRRFYPGFLR